MYSTVGFLLFLVQSLRFFLFPEETETVNKDKEEKTVEKERDTEGEVGWCCLIIVKQGRSETKKTHELISYQIYMRITINYSEILGMLGTIIRSTCRHYVNVILFLFPM